MGAAASSASPAAAESEPLTAPPAPSALTSVSAGSAMDDVFEDADGTRTIAITKEAGAPLGLELVDGGSAIPFASLLLGSRPPFVAIESVAPQSAAHGRLEVGMEIVQVNGVNAASAAQCADVIRASGGTIHVKVRVATTASAVDHATKYAMDAGGGTDTGTSLLHGRGGMNLRQLLLLGIVACGVLALGVANALSASSAYKATLTHEQTQREAREWQKRAKVKMAQLEQGKEAQQALAAQAQQLQRKIFALSQANASASTQAVQALASLRAQHANVTAQRKAWRRAKQESEMELRRAKKAQSTMLSTLSAERKKAKDALAKLDAARAEAREGVKKERALIQSMRLRMRLRLAEVSAEIESLAGSSAAAPDESLGGGGGGGGVGVTLASAFSSALSSGGMGAGLSPLSMAERRAVARTQPAGKAIGPSSRSSVRATATSTATPPPCCTDASPDGGGRKPSLCMRYAGAGACDGAKNSNAKEQCPAACGACLICTNHPMYDSYTSGELHGIRKAAAERLARRSQRLASKGALFSGGGGGGGGGGDLQTAAADDANLPDAPPFPLPSAQCGRLNSSAVPAAHRVEPFASVRDATRVARLVGDGLIATSCVGHGWDYLVTRSIANHYPRGDVSAFFDREARNMCPFLRWDGE